MHILDIIQKKKENKELTKKEIDYVIEKFDSQEIFDYQMATFLTCIYFNSMSEQEIFYLTNAMIQSGKTLKLDELVNVSVDKHSTGGVGDKTSLILAPILACFDISVAKMSGRGLGNTGGTIDKLEAIDGFTTKLSQSEFIKQLKAINMAIISQSSNLVPADKKIYALRDATNIVDSLPLIASSIMSKKIASGSKVIILDIKCGSGAFMKSLDDAEKLAKIMIKIGNKFNKKTIAFITDMQQPLGKTIGNALEVQEALKVMQNQGEKDITELSIELAAEALVVVDKYPTKEIAITKINEILNSGQAYNKFREFVDFQQGNLNDLNLIETKLQLASNCEYIRSKKSGYVFQANADIIGRCAMLLGAGRSHKDDELDYQVGIKMNKKVGDFVEKNEELCQIHFNSNKNIELVKTKLQEAFIISEQQVIIPKVIKKIIK